MASCCRAGPAEEMFRPRTARRDLARYRSRGLGALERKMLDCARTLGLERARVLEIGGGIGALQSEMLASGADRGEIVELVRSYEPYAYELARERGLEGRVAYAVADVLQDEGAVEPADVVVLNRVVCCSPDGVELAAAAARLTRRALVLSYPKDGFRSRQAVRLLNAGFWLMRRSFRTFVHSTELLVATVEGEGLRLVERGSTTLWEFAAFRRG